MKITGINVYQVDLPLKEGRYSWSEGKYVEVFDSTVVEIQTDGGVTGYGEVCPLGPVYLPSYAEGARSGIAFIAGELIGLDPTNIGMVNEVMDRSLKGHPYVKSAIDMACWDLFGKACGQPVCNLLGGRFGEDVRLYRAISQRPAEEMASNVAGYREEGYRRFQLKVGGKPHDDIQRIRAVAAVMQDGDVLVADANTGWLMHEAVRIVRAVADIDVYIEQPCPTYEECLTVRRQTNHPFIIDESMYSIAEILRGHADRAMDAVNIKISKFGGLSRAAKVRDLCVELGLAMTIEDSWGGDIITAAIAHLAHSTPERYRFSSTDFNSYGSRTIAEGAPKRVNGGMKASERPGLGVDVILSELGDPVLRF
ncbi:MAG: mandelate racemase [Spirochaetaceae bacterium]|nr:MAG: mandelate racemase [Spirochaetaceae bacterium]